MKTKTRTLLDLTNSPDLRWNSSGYASFKGQMQQLFRNLDSMFEQFATSHGAEELSFPCFIDAAELNKIDYFKSFPHIATFPISAGTNSEDIAVFSGAPINENGDIQLPSAQPIQQVLTPAACYHCYVFFQSSDLKHERLLTTCSNCFRRETTYSPLQRQWNFSMREIVSLGSEEEVQARVQTLREMLHSFFREHKLPVEFQPATDPFFNPARNPKYLMQKLDNVKTEMVYDNSLAIGSINFHQTCFGDAFQITRSGMPASSACVAFGIERWMYMYLKEFGTDASSYPILKRAMKYQEQH